MRYVGLKLQKIDGEKFSEPKGGNIKVDSNFNLGKIKLESELGVNKEKPIFSFEFNYSILYEDFAKISFKGTIFVEIDDKKLIKELEKEEPRSNDAELRKLILDVVLAKTHVESLHLEEKLNLPFHIQSPRVKFEN